MLDIAVGKKMNGCEYVRGASIKMSSPNYSAISNTLDDLVFHPTEGRWFFHFFQKISKPFQNRSDLEIRVTFVDNYLNYLTAFIYSPQMGKKIIREIEYIQRNSEPLTDEQIDTVKLLNVQIEKYSDDIVLRELYKAVSDSIEELNLSGSLMMNISNYKLNKGDCSRRKAILERIAFIQENRYQQLVADLDKLKPSVPVVAPKKSRFITKLLCKNA
jgi:hypothetical protein